MFNLGKFKRREHFNRTQYSASIVLSTDRIGQEDNLALFTQVLMDHGLIFYHEISFESGMVFIQLGGMRNDNTLLGANIQVPFAALLDERTWVELLEQLISKLASAQTIFPEVTLVIGVSIAREGLLGYGEWKGVQIKGVIEIYPEEDPSIQKEHCFSQAIGLGVLERVPKLQHLGSATIANIRARHPSNQKMFQYRQIASEWICSLVHSNCKIQTLALIEQLQNVLEVEIVILNARLQRFLMVPTSFETKIYLYKASDTHVDYIRQIHSFLDYLVGKEKKHFCLDCSLIYSKNRWCSLKAKEHTNTCAICHKCEKRCMSCLRLNQECIVTLKSGSCSQCHRPFRGEECQAKHICPYDMGVKCKTCFRFHWGNKCGELLCRLCYTTYHKTETHVCSIRAASKMRDCSEKIAAFDIESVVDTEGKQFLLLLCVQRYQVDEEPLCFYDYDSFYTFLMDECKGYTFFAHNAKGYDNIFIKQMFMERGVHTYDISTGMKYLEIKTGKGKEMIVFRDFMCFVTGSLDRIGKDFKCQVKKGFFPYEAATKEWMDNGCPILEKKPPVSSYPAKVHSDPDFIAYYEALPETQYDMKSICETYCQDDVRLLLEICVKFRQQMLDISTEINCGQQLDILQYMTAPSAIFNFYKTCFLKEGDMLPIRTTDFIRARMIKSVYKDEEVNPYQQPALFGIECYQREMHCDLFKLCKLDGCLKHSKPYSILERKKGRSTVTVNDKAIQLERQQLLLHSKGYTTTVYWSCAFDMEADVQDENMLPLLPRNAYRGGFSEVLTHDAIEDTVACVDVVSEYPTMMMGGYTCPMTHVFKPFSYPKGPYVSTYKPDFIDVEKEGLVKCRFIPPPKSSQKQPLLGLFVEGNKGREVLYVTCATCAKTRQQTTCEHSDQERAFICTITYPEFRSALKLGYIVDCLIDKMEYAEKTTDLFTGYLNHFYKLKATSKRQGVVDETGCFTEDGIALQKELHDRLGEWVQPDAFQDRPISRTIGKLFLNSFYGKLGEKDIKRMTRDFDASEVNVVREYMDIVQDDTKVLKGERFWSDTKVTLSWEEEEETNTSYTKKNVVAAAYTTAGGRIYMIEFINYLLALQYKVLYSDTDSVYFSYTSTDFPFSTGKALGDLEVEYTGMTQFFALGRKSYFSKLDNGRSKFMMKGIQKQDLSNCSITAASLKEKFIQQLPLEYPQMHILTHRDAEGQLFKQIKHSIKKCTFDTPKRVIVEQGKRTYAFGNQ